MEIINDKYRYATRKQVWNSVWDRVGNKINSQLWGSSITQVWNRIRDRIKDNEDNLL